MLYKTTIILWSEYDTHKLELAELAREATEGNSYCSTVYQEPITDPTKDSDWDGTEFFSPDGE